MPGSNPEQTNDTDVEPETFFLDDDYVYCEIPLSEEGSHHDEDPVDEKQECWKTCLFFGAWFSLMSLAGCLFFMGPVCHPLIEKYSDFKNVYSKSTCVSMGYFLNDSITCSCVVSCGEQDSCDSCVSTFPCVTAMVQYDYDDNPPKEGNLYRSDDDTTCSVDLVDDCQEETTTNNASVQAFLDKYPTGKKFDCFAHKVMSDRVIVEGPTHTKLVHCFLWAPLVAAGCLLLCCVASYKTHICHRQAFVSSFHNVSHQGHHHAGYLAHVKNVPLEIIDRGDLEALVLEEKKVTDL